MKTTLFLILVTTSIVNSFANQAECSHSVSKVVNALVLATNTQLAEVSSSMETSLILDYWNESNTILGFRASKGNMHYLVEVKKETCEMVSVKKRNSGGSIRH